MKKFLTVILGMMICGLGTLSAQNPPMPTKTLTGTVTYADKPVNESAVLLAKLEFISNLDATKQYELYTNPYMNGAYQITLPMGSYTVKAYTQGASAVVNPFVLMTDSVLDIAAAVDLKSVIIGVFPVDESDQQLNDIESMMYSLDNRTTWTSFPKTEYGTFVQGTNNDPIIFYYGEGAVDLATKMTNSAYKTDTFTLTHAEMTKNLDKAAEYIYRPVMKGFVDTMFISGHIERLNMETYEGIPIPNASITIFSDVNEYADVLVTAKANDSGYFSLKFLGSPTKIYGVELTDPTGKYVTQNQSNTFYAELGNVNEWKTDNFCTNNAMMILNEPALLTFTAVQPTKGVADVLLSWELDPILTKIGLGIDSITIDRYAMEYNSFEDKYNWDMGTKIASITDPTKVTFNDNETTVSDLPVELGQKYRYDISVFYTGGDPYIPQQWKYGHDKPEVNLSPLTYNLQFTVKFVNPTNGTEFADNILCLTSKDTLTGGIPAFHFDEILAGDYASIDDVVGGEYTLAINSKGESFKGVLNITKDSSYVVSLVADANSNLVRLNIQESAEMGIGDASARVIDNAIKTIAHTDEMGYPAIMALPKGDYKIEIAALGYVTDTIDLTVASTFEEKTITLKVDLGTTVYWYGKFDDKTMGIYDVAGKIVKIENKATGRIFESVQPVTSQGDFAFDSLSIGESEWIFPTANIVTAAPSSGWFPGPPTETNDLTVTNEKWGEIKDSINYGIEQYGNLMPLPLYRKSFTIMGVVSQQNRTEFMGSVQIQISSNKDTVKEYLYTESSAFKFEGFKGNDNFHFVITCGGYKTIDTTIVIKFRDITNSMSNIFVAPAFELVPELSEITAEGTITEEMDGELVEGEGGTAVVIPGAIVEIFGIIDSNVFERLAIDTTDANGGFNVPFQGYYNTGTPYLVMIKHPLYHREVDLIIAEGEPKLYVFEELNKRESCLLTLLSNNAAYGTVNGAGTFLEGDTVTITAVPITGKGVFVEWEHEDTTFSKSLVYKFVITDTMTVTAIFKEYVSIEDAAFASVSIYANKGAIQIQGLTTNTNVEILDLLGRTLVKATTGASYTAQMPATGIYMVRLTNSQGSISRKLIVK